MISGYPDERTTGPELKSAGNKILQVLIKIYTPSKSSIDRSNPLELLISTILSAQCTDQRVNSVTGRLFKKYRSASDFARADRRELEREIRTTGYYKTKAGYLIGSCKKLIADFEGKVPSTMAGLITLPGVGRKTANVVLSNYFHKTEGIIVDTHVSRVARRLKLSEMSDPGKIERDLMQIFDKRDWMKVSSALLLHGRHLCKSRKPECARCPVERHCPSSSLK